MVHARTLDGRELELDGRGLEAGALVLRDIQTRSEWNQLLGRSVRGPLDGRVLPKLASTLTTWGEWRRLHPETSVWFDPAASHAQRIDAYGYARRALEGAGGEELVVGLEKGGAVRAWPFRILVDRRLLNDEVGGEPVLVLLASDDVTVRVYSRRVDGKELVFALEGDELRDAETSSRWEAATGVATAGPMEGKRLELLPSTAALWSAWKSAQPDASLWQEEVGSGRRERRGERP